MNYTETIEFLTTRLQAFHKIGKEAYKANLNNTIILDEYFNHPHRNFKTIHIAGSNGKGSVSHMIASVLQAAGYKTGLYTSPHLKDFRERIKINGEMISELSVVNFIENNKAIIEKINPSFFEITCALAFKYFSEQNVDIAVIETGLGGRLDSTNIIQPLLSVITNISFDHTDLLGDTIEKIAFEKAGIIKHNTPVVIGESQGESLPVFKNAANKSNSTIIIADFEYSAEQIKNSNEHTIYNIYKHNRIYLKNLALDLHGDYQKNNILTALTSIDILNHTSFKIPEKDIYKGLSSVTKNTGFKGRWQILGKAPLVICDTAHNEAGFIWVINQIKNTPHKNLHFIFGTVKDKNISKILKILPVDANYYFTKASIPRALCEKELKQIANIEGLNGESYSTVTEALMQAKLNSNINDLIFIGGSNFIVAEVL